METTTRTAQTPITEFIEASRVFLREDYMPKLLHCIENFSEDDLWWRPNEVSNSAGNLILHLCGNLRQWIVSSVGGAEFNRNRDAEFSERGPIPKATLIDNLKKVVAEVDGVFASVPESQLLARHKIQIYEVTTLQAIY